MFNIVDSLPLLVIEHVERIDRLLITAGIFQDKIKCSTCNLECRYCVFTLWGRYDLLIILTFRKFTSISWDSVALGLTILVHTSLIFFVLFSFGREFYGLQIYQAKYLLFFKYNAWADEIEIGIFQFKSIRNMKDMI